MKNIINLILLMTLSVVIGCEKKTLEEVDNIHRIENRLTAGKWVVSLFIDSEKDETYHFTGFEFSFQSNGIVIAERGTTIHEGTWSVVHNEHNHSSEGELTINFLLPEKFTDLNDDWDILNITTSQIELIDISGGNGGTDYLTFIKK